MERTLRVLNKMVRDGVIETYAIGGAVAAIYYLEPFDTADLDVFVDVKTPGDDLMILAPIYNYLAKLGYHPKDEFVHIEDLPVQILPVFNSLTDEAVRRAHTIKFGRTRTREMRAEHLVAIMLDTGRLKDFARISLFLEHKKVNRRSLQAALKRHGLTQKWKENQRGFES